MWSRITEEEISSSQHTGQHAGKEDVRIEHHVEELPLHNLADQREEGDDEEEEGPAGE